MRARTPDAAAINPLLFVVAALTLSGCWIAPIANVQPKGEPRLIQAAIVVESVKKPAMVQSVDVSARTVIVLGAGDVRGIAYKAGPRVSNLDQIKTGDEIQATVREQLAVYVLKDGQLPDAAGAARKIQVNAKVLMVDPSYRLLTLQYPDGRDETFKVGLDVKLLQMQAGDDVAIRTIEATALQVRKR